MKRRTGRMFRGVAPWLLLLPVLAACGDGTNWSAEQKDLVGKLSTQQVVKTGPDGKEVSHQRPYLIDARGRYVWLNGVNLSGSDKFPANEVFADMSAEPSYVGKPFPLDKADEHFARLRELGFNSIRLLTSWEAIEPSEPGVYDGDYLIYLEQVVKKAQEHGIYVLMDMHQDMFSRHLYAKYNDNVAGQDGSLEKQVLALLPPYDNWTRGDGAPRWVIRKCLPEKNLDSPHWGELRILGSLEPVVVEAVFKHIDLLDLPGGELAIVAELAKVIDPDAGITLGVISENLQILLKLKALMDKLSPEGDGTIPQWLAEASTRLPGRFDITETCDFLPTTFWGLNSIVSADLDRCVSAFFAGNEVFPEMTVDGQNIQDWLQDHYIKAWLQVVKRVKKYDNVVGYDLMNEPVGFFPALTAIALLVQTGAFDKSKDAMISLFGEELGTTVFDLAVSLQVIPPDNKPDTLKKWGVAGLNAMALLDLNLAFDGKYLQRFYEKAGLAIQAEDPGAIIWIEPGMTVKTVTGPSPQWDSHLTKPEKIRQLVFAPHWYPDIYPTIGFDVQPRTFQADEWLYRDFAPEISKFMTNNASTVANVPVVFGEFGTYFNFNGIAESIADDYAVSAAILNNYYTAFEQLGIGKMLWTYSPENTAENGDGWNKEDFSLLGPDGKPRAWQAYVRPTARATSGKLISQRFQGPLNFVDPEKGQVLDDRLYVLEMESKETDAPTAVYVPELQYPDGFYVWLSDGAAYYQHELQTLFWYPYDDDPAHTHSLTIRPKFAGQDYKGWSYFFKGSDKAAGGAL